VFLFFSISRNVSLKTVALSFSEESEEKDMESDHKMPTVLKMTTGRLFSKKVPSFKLSATFSTLILEGTASIIS